MMFVIEVDDVEYSVFFKMYGNDAPQHLDKPVFQGWDVTVALGSTDKAKPDPIGCEFWFANRTYPTIGDARTYVRMSIPVLAKQQ